MEFQAANGFSPARHGQWLALAEALDAAVVTLHAAIPDPLWFGPARNSFDHHVELVKTELRLARGDVLDAEAGLP
jgi:hypothetical protein